jgi:ubiquinol-cytochrome c reductase cytochrome b subunit
MARRRKTPKPDLIERSKRQREWLDERLGSASWAIKGMRYVFPDHWSFLLGEIALFCFVILVATGIFLTLFFRPDSTEVVYHGSYAALDGTRMSAAYQSVLDISFDVKLGLLMRQIHHWAANIFVVTIVLHQLRVFFTGAFRRPRELNWILGVTMLILAIGLGFTGYSLPDDLLSGTGLRIAYSVVLGIPFVGPYLAFLLFGGEWPTTAAISRLFVMHVMLLPALMIGLIGAHLALIMRQHHADFPGAGKTEHNVVGQPLWPSQALKSTGLMLITAGVIAALAGLVQINPIWAYGPYLAAHVSAPAQPDWYVGWLEGSLRLFPAAEFSITKWFTWPTTFAPSVVIPGIVFTIMYLYPFLEKRYLTHDYREHNLLDQPYTVPARAGIGMAAFTFVFILTVAGGNDVLALTFNTSIDQMTWILRVAVIVAPIIMGFVTARIARGIGSGGSTRFKTRQHGLRLRRNAEGGFEEVGEHH